MILHPLLIVFAGVVLVRCICMAPRLSPGKWTGHPGRLAGMVVAFGLLGGGAIGAVMTRPYAAYLLLAGIALLFIFDRRVGA